MGCDYYADENGTFEVVVQARESGETQRIVLTGLEPNEELDQDLIAGTER